MVRGNHQFGLRRAASRSGIRCRRPTSARRAPSPSTAASPASASPTSCSAAPFSFIQSAPNTLDMTQQYFGLYAQDTWKLSPTMTLNYGVRWEPWFPQQHENGAIYNFSPERFRAGQRSTVFPQAPPGSPIPATPASRTARRACSTDWMNFAPRVGVAWDPNGDGRTSVRAGYGMNSDFVNGQFFINAANAPPWGSEVRLTRPSIGPFDDPFAGTGVDQSVPGHLRRRTRRSRRTARTWCRRRTSTRRACTAGTSACSGSSATTWRCRPATSATTRPTCGTSSPATRARFRRRSPTGPCTLNTPTGPQTFAELLGGAARLAARADAGEPGGRPVHRLPRLLHRPRHAEVQRAAAVGAAARRATASAPAPTTRCRSARAIRRRAAPRSNVGHRLHDAGVV